MRVQYVMMFLFIHFELIVVQVSKTDSPLAGDRDSILPPGNSFVIKMNAVPVQNVPVWNGRLLGLQCYYLHFNENIQSISHSTLNA